MRYGCRNNIWRRGDQCARKSQDYYIGHSKYWELSVAEALIGCGRLLQAAIGIDPLGAIAIVILRERYCRGKGRDDACLTRIHQLGEQHRAEQNTAQRNSHSAKPFIHGTGINP